MNITDFDLKWVHMARDGLILRQDGAIWLRIICKPLPTPKTILEWQKMIQKSKNPEFQCFFCIFGTLPPVEGTAA